MAMSPKHIATYAVSYHTVKGAKGVKRVTATSRQEALAKVPSSYHAVEVSKGPWTHR